MAITIITEPLHKDAIISHNVVDRIITIDTRSEQQRQEELAQGEAVKKLQYGALTADKLVIRKPR